MTEAVEQGALWGGETEKAVANFPVSGDPIPTSVARWLGRIKAASARANADLDLLDRDRAERIAAAGDRIAAGEFDDQFPIDVFHGELLCLVEPLAQRLAFDERHHEIHNAVALSWIEQWKDMRMIEPSGQLDLAAETIGAQFRRQIRPQDLDRDVALVPEVTREVYGGHAALADLTFDLVSVGERGGEFSGRRQGDGCVGLARGRDDITCMSPGLPAR